MRSTHGREAQWRPSPLEVDDGSALRAVGRRRVVVETVIVFVLAVLIYWWGLL
ncbi:hypothetical protein Pd630_LPD00754 [Rhodococcus opacus PD630]|nr:hypothetical protein Pd630_LPD00754 [Rhodococcus opacus PD630]